MTLRHGGVPPARPLPIGSPACRLEPMKELLRSNDPVYLSFVRHVLSEAGIDYLQLDEYMSALEGSVGAIPRRIMVLGEDEARARLSLGNAMLTRK
jgi:hypothetical protein